MATLLIILLGTVLIQGSSIAAGDALSRPSVRGVFADEFRTAAFTLISVTLASVGGFTLMSVLSSWQAEYFRTPLLLAATALIFLLTRTLLHRIPGLVRWPDVLTHLTTQCALFGMALFSAAYLESLAEAFAYGLSAALLLAILSAAFNDLRERVDQADVPVVFRGIPVALITAGFMALAMMGFMGVVRH